MTNKFKLKVQKHKCIDCDLLFLIEDQYFVSFSDIACPTCKDVESVEFMENLTIEEV